MAKKKIEKLKIKLDLKLYKRIARDLFSLKPTYVHKNREKYDRKKEKQLWKKQVKQEMY